MNTDKCFISELECLSSFSAVFGSAYTERETKNSDVDLCFYANTRGATEEMLNRCLCQKQYISKVGLNGYSIRPLIAGTGKLHICIFNSENKFKEFLDYDKKQLNTFSNVNNCIQLYDVPLRFQLRSTAAADA